MSSQPIKTPTPRRLLLVGMIALVAAGAIATYGLISRARSKQDLVQWTNAQTVPTVALAKLARGEPHPYAAAYRLDRFATGRLIDERGAGAQPNLH